MADMDYIRRQALALKNKQFLTSFDWELEIDFSEYPFYHPTMHTIHLQNKSVNPSDTIIKPETPQNVEIRGFKIHQPGMNKMTDATLQLDLVDFEDQSMKYWFIDWINKCDSITTHASYRRDQLMVNATLYRLNNERQRVFMLQYYNCLPSSPNYQEAWDGEKKLVGDNTSITLAAEFMIPTPLVAPLS